MTDPGHHLVTLEDMPRARLLALLDRAESLRTEGAPADLLAGRTVLNLFFEPSTRTRTSFELAARRLGAWVVNFDTAHASTAKGESLLDTLHTLEAMQLDALVVRHREAGTPALLARNARSRVAVINAGDGNRGHPTQGLLDALTIRQQRPDFAALTVTICGDLVHSRVARSDIDALLALGVGEIRLCGPQPFLPAAEEVPGCVLCGDFNSALEGVDVVIMLRLQRERMGEALVPDDAGYFAEWGLSAERLKRAAPECLVLHPGPINRGIEIAAEVADGPQSMILRQVANGIHVRMAVLADLLGG